MSFCCGCLSCCCGGRHSSRRPKHFDEPTSHRSAPPPATSGYTPSQPPSYSAPQFATFSTSNKDGAGGKAVNEDTLPEMPTWESARTRKVLLEAEPSQKGHTDDVELGDLNHSKKATGSRAPMLAHAAPPAGYDDIGVATPMQSPYRNPQDRGHGGGYGRGQEPISPYGEPHDFIGGYKRSGTSKSSYGQAYGGPQQMPEGPYHEDYNPPYPKDDYSGDKHRNNTGGYSDSTHAYGQHENFQPQMRNGHVGVNTRSPPPAFQAGGFGPRSSSPFSQDEYNSDRSGTAPPMHRQYSNGYTDNPQPNTRSATADLPAVLTTGPKSQTPLSANHQNSDRPYRAYSPSPASPAYVPPTYRPI